MKRRQFIKISALSSAAIAAAAALGIQAKQEVEAGWFKNSKCMAAPATIGGDFIEGVRPAVFDVIMFKTVRGFVIGTTPTHFKAIPIRKDERFQDEDFESNCLIVQSAKYFY